MQISPSVIPVAGQKPATSYFWPMQIAGWTGYFAYVYLMALAHGKPAGYWTVSFTTAMAGFVATSALRYVLRALWHLPAPIFLLAALVPALIATAIMGATYITILVEWCADCSPSGVLGYIAYMSSFIYVVLAWSALYFGIKNLRQLQEQTQTALKATAMAHQAQLKMLRYQLNPHFLFNTLNAISTLILDQNSQTANRMVTSLAAFLRHSLDADPMQRVTLKQELDALNLYLGIEKIRFTDRLRLSFEIEPETYEALLPGLLLQPLIENAIKYAVAKRVEGGAIELTARRVGDQLEIVLADDGPGSPQFEQGLPVGNGVGLRNTRERLAVLYGESQSFEVRNRKPRGAEVVLRLPFETSGRVVEG